MIEVRCLDISHVSQDDYDVLYYKASPERKSRADRYLRQEDRIRCVAADALLRLVPGYDQSELLQTPAGKPYFKDSCIQFNLSHSGRWVVIAWGSTPVGIDVEQIRMDQGKRQLAKRFFCPDEQQYVFEAPEEEQGKRFFQIWTGKESYLKYQGTGINRPLNSFSVHRELPGVMLLTRFFEDACMTVCCEENIHCRMVTLRQLLGT